MSAEVIISMVEQQPAIWDKGCEQYKDRISKDKAWATVASEVCEEWDSLSKEEQSKQLNYLKAKWKNIKDSMLKSLQLQTKRGDCAPKKRKYVHFEALAFLRTSSEKRSTSGNYEDDNTADPDADGLAILDDQTDSLTSTSSIDSPHSGRRRRVFKKPSQPPKITPFPASLLSSLDHEAKTIHSPQNDTEDADKSYLMSLLPDYKNLTTAKKWEFRTQVANFFQNYYQPQCLEGDPQQFWSITTNTNDCYSTSASPTGSIASRCTPSPNPQ